MKNESCVNKATVERMLYEETLTLKGMVRINEYTIDELAEQKGIILGLLLVLYIMSEESDYMDFYDYREAYEEKEGINLWRE